MNDPLIFGRPWTQKILITPSLRQTRAARGTRRYTFVICFLLFCFSILSILSYMWVRNPLLPLWASPIQHMKAIGEMLCSSLKKLRKNVDMGSWETNSTLNYTFCWLVMCCFEWAETFMAKNVGICLHCRIFKHYCLKCVEYKILYAVYNNQIYKAEALRKCCSTRSRWCWVWGVTANHVGCGRWD